MPALPRNRPAQLALVTLVLLAVVLVFSPHPFRYGHQAWFSRASQTSLQPQLPCQRLPGADETLVVLKTSASELPEKLPILQSTSLRCYPNYLIFSDYEEYYEGEHVIDALESVTDDVQETHPDFDFYRRLKRKGREALRTNDDDNLAQKLDKWKFLPMVNKAFHDYPHMKWYVFIEPESYVLWSSLLPYLAMLDHRKPLYIGSKMSIDGTVFAHSGAGIIVSRHAMKLVVNHLKSHQRELEAITNDNLVGGAVLGRAFKDAGVKLTDAWPTLQEYHPGVVPYVRSNEWSEPDARGSAWCYPAVSYFKVPADAVKDIWAFEQQRIAPAHGIKTEFLRHKHIFIQYVMPRMSMSRVHWDNQSGQETTVVETFESCRVICENDLQCLQYSFDTMGVCRTHKDPRLGEEMAGVQSGWMMDRVHSMVENMPTCGGERWMIDT